jgi:hypothetical protein
MLDGTTVAPVSLREFVVLDVWVLARIFGRQGMRRHPLESCRDPIT